MTSTISGSICILEKLENLEFNIQNSSPLERHFVHKMVLHDYDFSQRIQAPKIHWFMV